MTGSTPPTLYLGGPIEHESERIFIAALFERLKAVGQAAVVFANVHLPGHQLDAVIATPSDVILVEVKSSHLPVRGGLNGQWARRDAGGAWRDYGNGYQQALKGKMALRDTFTAWSGSRMSYPSGRVVFIPGLPEGSELTAGDYKVAITDLSAFLSSLTGKPDPSWNPDVWVGFARHLGLKAVRVDQLANSPADQARAAMLAEYGTAFLAQYEGPAATWLAEDSEQAQTLIAAAAGAGIHLYGPSGCGKTLMAHRLAVEFARRGSPIVFLAGKDISGSWWGHIRRELGLLVDARAEVLLATFKDAPASPVLVVDGLNEITGSGNDAVRAIKALARRYSAKLVITDQQPPGDAFAGLTGLVVTEPSSDLKRRIAGCSELAPPNVQQALDVAKSGLEAAVIGQVRDELPAGVARLHLLERFARARLGGRARSATLGLRRLASRLHADVAFSLPEVAFDELMAANGVSAADADAMLDAHLLVLRAHRISFSHEMFQNAFAAFDWAAVALNDPKDVGERLSAPRMQPLAADILSAIDDASIVRAVLEASVNPDLIGTAAEGDCGPMAEVVARGLLEETVRACAAEIQTAALVLEPREHMSVDWDPTTLRDWSLPEIARLQAIGETARSASFELYMQLCAVMDARLDDEWRRLLPEARKRKIGLRSEAFGLAYFKFGREIGFSHASPNSIMASSSRRRRTRTVELYKLTSGQLHFVLDNRYSLFTEEEAEDVAAFLIDALQTRYSREPYHVRLAMLTAAGFVRNVRQETVAQLVAAIESLDTSNWALNSEIIDALKFLGAIDGYADGQREAIRDEVVGAIFGDVTEERCDAALTVYVNQFDHPYDSLYCEEVENLGPDRRLTLYRRALSASRVMRSISLTWLLHTVIKLDDATDEPLLRRFAGPPNPGEGFAQDQWAAFALVTRFLGRHGLRLQVSAGETPSARCLGSIQTVVHGHESKRGVDVADAVAAWADLNQSDVGLVIGCLAEMQAAISDSHRLEDNPAYPSLHIADAYPAECLALARRFFDERADATYHLFAHNPCAGGAFALSCIAKAGDRTDAPRLKILSQKGPLAPTALRILRALDVGETSIT